MDEPRDLDRYDRQMRFAPLGEAGQRKLAAGRVLVCGCGALGSVLADLLVRAGVGHVRIVDRDFVELSNLQRQVLFDEQDVADGLPKAIAATRKLVRINSSIEIEPIVTDVTHRNIRALADDVDVIVDGTDNFETRFLVNDYAIETGKPWIYGGSIGAEGQTMTILPGETACLRCLMTEPPPAGLTPTCDTAGILGPVVNVVASLEAVEALKLLSGNREAVSRRLTIVELWTNRQRQVDLSQLRETGDCPACSRREFPWLAGERGATSVVLCGRNAVQLRPERSTRLDLAALAERLADVGDVAVNEYLLRLALEDHVLSVFVDGRIIVSGTDDPAVARSLQARYIGS